MIPQKGRVLVIKLGALGDFVLATGPFAAIRAAHPNEEVILLTTAPFAEFARTSGYFDEVWVDARPSRVALLAAQRLRQKLRRGRFYRVYDLQTSGRSSWYFRLMRGSMRPQWSGIALGCSHPHANGKRNSMHTIDRQAEQLAMAGIPETPLPDLSWTTSDTSHFNLPAKFALMIPGGAAHRPGKRWPADNYRELGELWLKQGITPVIIGGPDEAKLAAGITDHTGMYNLAGQTSFADIAELSRRAAGVVGNDTGPMHIAAICGCPSMVLFSDESDPSITAPRGPDVLILRREKLRELPVSEVAEALSLR